MVLRMRDMVLLLLAGLYRMRGKAELLAAWERGSWRFVLREWGRAKVCGN